MEQAHPKAVWHLSRGHQQNALISDRELRLLAERGKLHGNDLLWRPGFRGWRTARSMPGLLTPPPLPRTNLLSARSDQTDANAPSPAADLEPDADIIESGPAFGRKLYEACKFIRDWLRRNVSRCLDELSLLAKDWLRSSKLYMRVYGRRISRFVKLAELRLEVLLSQIEHPRILAGLLAAGVLVGTLDIAMQASLADIQPAPQNSSSLEGQRPKPEAISAAELKEGGRGVTEQAISDRAVVDSDHAFNILNLQLSDGFGAAGNLSAEARSSSDPRITEVAEASNPVPLPTRKPAKPTKILNTAGNLRASVPAPRRMSHVPTRKAGRQPKRMSFGTIGFNYSDPAF